MREPEAHIKDDAQKGMWLLYLRHTAPLLFALIALIFSLFYNVYVVESGRRAAISALRLLFSTLSSGREVLMSGSAAGMRSYYIVLLIAALLCLLCFLAFVVVGVFSLVQFRRLLAARGCEDLAAEKAALVLWRTFFSQRWQLYASYFLLLPLPLYPWLFSLISRAFLSVSVSSVLYIRFNVAALAAALLLVILFLLIYLSRRHEKALFLDLFDLDGCCQREEAGEREHEQERDDEEVPEACREQGEAPLA